jgi:SpoVK/Ycf46/Vps4 family AAA+-type ATPase
MVTEYGRTDKAGEDKVNNVVHLATTNFPEKLDARFLGRPSRFDEIVRLPMPGTEMRRAYLTACLPSLPPETLSQWVADTEGFNFGHLRELVVATHALDRPYEETLERLREMKPDPLPKRGRGSGDWGLEDGWERD